MSAGEIIIAVAVFVILGPFLIQMAWDGAQAVVEAWASLFRGGKR